MNIIEHNLKFNSMNKRTKTNGIVIHYSASSNGTVETIHNYHKNSNGWAGIGYQFVIYKDGTIHRGRTEDSVGAHCVGHNSTKIGICLIGYYDKAHDGTPPKAQMDACIELCKYLLDKYNLKSSDIYRHRDFNATACPGDVDIEYIKKMCATTPKPTPTPNNAFKVKITCNALNIRSSASITSKIVGCIRDKGVYTIVETKGTWGKLKSGVGWISLNYTKKL